MIHAVRALLILAGVINLLPVVGVLSAARLERLYAIPFADPGTILLMRHRAVLFGLLGAFMIVAAFRPEWRWPACIGGLISMLSFIALALAVTPLTPAFRTIVIADIVGSLAVIAAMILMWGSDHR